MLPISLNWTVLIPTHVPPTCITTIFNPWDASLKTLNNVINWRLLPYDDRQVQMKNYPYPLKELRPPKNESCWKRKTLHVWEIQVSNVNKRKNKRRPIFLLFFSIFLSLDESKTKVIMSKNLFLHTKILITSIEQQCSFAYWQKNYKKNRSSLNTKWRNKMPKITSILNTTVCMNS